METIIIILIIGIFAGVFSGFIGIGGGLIVVPCLVYFLGMTQHGAQGTSLAMMLPPIGFMAVYNYHKTGSSRF
ncbi:MAG: TSUP family transporter [Bacteroidetes bacterium]|nr:TSUP family transporter [Bacteroidota bacterium]